MRNNLFAVQRVIFKIFFSKPIAIFICVGMSIGKGGLYFAATEDFLPMIMHLISPTTQPSHTLDNDKKIAAWLCFCFVIRTLAVYGPLTYNKFSKPPGEGITCSNQAITRRKLLRCFLIQGTSLATAFSAYFGVRTLLADDVPILKKEIILIGLPLVMGAVSYCSEKSLGGDAIEKCLDENMTIILISTSGKKDKILKYFICSFLFAQSTDEAAAILFLSYILGNGNIIWLIAGTLGAITTFARTIVLYGPRMKLFKYQLRTQSSTEITNAPNNAPESNNQPNETLLAKALGGGILLTTASGKMFIAIDGFVDAYKLATQTNSLDINKHIVYSIVISFFSLAAFIAELFFGYQDTCAAIDTFLSKAKLLFRTPNNKNEIHNNLLPTINNS